MDLGPNNLKLRRRPRLNQLVRQQTPLAGASKSAPCPGRSAQGVGRMSKRHRTPDCLSSIGWARVPWGYEIKV